MVPNTFYFNAGIFKAEYRGLYSPCTRDISIVPLIVTGCDLPRDLKQCLFFHAYLGWFRVCRIRSLLVFSEQGHPMTPQSILVKHTNYNDGSGNKNTWKKRSFTSSSKSSNNSTSFYKKDSNYSQCSSLWLGCVRECWHPLAIQSVFFFFFRKICQLRPFYPCYVYPHSIFMFTPQSPLHVYNITYWIYKIHSRW